MRRIFIQLVRPGEGTEDTRRIATKGELGEESWSLVKELADARLVITSRNAGGQETVEIVHEALIRNWGELRGWMDTDRVFRAWQERLRGAMRQWQETKQDEGSLLRGTALTEAEEQLRKRPDELVAESGFIEKSLHERERFKQVKEKAVHEKKRQQQVLIRVMSLGLLITSGAAIFSLFQVQKVQRQRVEQLVANAKVLLANNQTVDAVINTIVAKGLSQQFFVQFPDYPQFASVDDSLMNVVEENRERNNIGHGYKAYVNSVAYSPDGQYIVTGSNNESLTIWNAKTGIRQQTFKIKEIDEDNNSSRTSVNSVAYSPDGQRIISSRHGKTVIIYDVKTGRPIGKPLQGHKDGVTSVAYSPDGQRIISGSDDKTIIIYDVKTGRPIGEPLQGHKDRVTSVAYSPDGQHIISGSSDKTIIIWNAKTGRPIGKPLQGHKDRVTSVAYSPDGQHIISGSSDKTIIIWDAKTGRPIGKPLQGHKDEVTSVAYSPDGQRIISGSGDKTIIIWDAKTGRPIGKPLQGHKDGVTSVAYSPDGQRIISGSNDMTLIIWEMKIGEPIGEPLQGHKDSVNSVAYSPDSQRIISGSDDKTVMIWDAKTGVIMGKPLQGHKDKVNSVAYSPDGQQIISGSDDKTVIIWDAKTGVIMGKPLQGHKDRVKLVAYSPDGQQIISGSDDKTVIIWDAKTGAIMGKPLQSKVGKSDSKPYPDGENVIAYSPDGKHIVSQDLILSDGTVMLWDIRTGTSQPLSGVERVNSVAYNPDNRRIVTGSFYGELRISDAETGLPISASLPGNSNLEKPHELTMLTNKWLGINSVAFSPDGKRFISGGSDNTVRLWDVSNKHKSSGKDLLSLACNQLRYHPHLNPTESNDENESDVARKAQQTCEQYVWKK